VRYLDVMRPRSVLLIAAIAAACAASEGAKVAQPPSAAAPVGPRSAATPGGSAPPATPGGSAPPPPGGSRAPGVARPSSAAVVTGSQPNPSHSFPPADIAPPYPRSAAEGDGVWKPFGDARGADGRPLVVATEVHPHAVSSFHTLTLVAIDRTRTELGFLPGVADVGKMTVPFVPGLVPAGDRGRLVAVFNGGFLPRHGRWGMRVGQTTIMAPRDSGCTLFLFANGDVRIASWPSVMSSDTEIRALRQTPPCLLENGAIHADLSKNQDRAWGGKTPGVVTHRRSAVGLSADGRVLYYAIGVETSPKLLAQGLLAAGVHVAAQLDINWNWTRFFVFRAGSDGALGIAESLLPVEYSKRDYVERPSERDFFYVLGR
jgi:hypothetical protein